MKEMWRSFWRKFGFYPEPLSMEGIWDIDAYRARMQGVANELYAKGVSLDEINKLWLPCPTNIRDADNEQASRGN